MTTPVIKKLLPTTTRRLTRLEHIRSKGHSPTEMRRRAVLMRSFCHWGYADLLEAEADVQETVTRVWNRATTEEALRALRALHGVA